MATKKDATADGEGKKGKGKLIILIVLLLFVLGGAGGGWYWWKHVKNADVEDVEDEDSDAPVKKKKKKKKDKEAAGPIFISLDPFTVNLQGEDGRLLQTVIALQMADEEDANKLKLHMPLVRSRLVMLLSGKQPEEVLTAEGKLKLAGEIAEQIKQPFSQGDAPMEIQNVLFTSFIVQ